jgi:hypothetical protein
MTSIASGCLSVTISSAASCAMAKDVSTSLPLTLPAKAALARPAPMLAATWATVTGCSKVLWLPSGSVITGMGAALREGW